MKILAFRFLLVAASLSTALCASAQNIVQDPGFEAAIGAAGVRTFYDSGSTIDGGLWTLAAPSSGAYNYTYVDRNPAYVITGATSLLLSGTSARQTLSTTANQAYTVSFDTYGYFGSTPVVVGFGASSRTLAVPAYASTNPVVGVTHFSFLANATGPLTLMSFGVTDASALEIDNVSVVAVPESTSGAALGLGALAMLRRRRKDKRRG